MHGVFISAKKIEVFVFSNLVSFFAADNITDEMIRAANILFNQYIQEMK